MDRITFDSLIMLLIIADEDGFRSSYHGAPVVASTMRVGEK